MIPTPQDRQELFINLLIDIVSGEEITLPTPLTTYEQQMEELATAVQTRLATFVVKPEE